MNKSRIILAFVLYMFVFPCVHAGQDVVESFEILVEMFRQSMSAKAPVIVQIEPDWDRFNEDKRQLNKLTSAGISEGFIYEYLSKETANPPSISWAKRQVFIEQLSYDVRKTDSLITPFIGEIYFICSAKAGGGSTKEEAVSSTYKYEASGEDGKELIARYALQKGFWILKSAKHKTGDAINPEDYAKLCAEELPESN